MLALTRQVNESIRLVEADVVITVVRIAADRVRLAISAPDQLTILREEIVEQSKGSDLRQVARRLRKGAANV